jgi:hypothetical protein
MAKMRKLRSAEKLSDRLTHWFAIARTDSIIPTFFQHMELLLPQAEQLSGRTWHQSATNKGRHDLTIAKNIAVGSLALFRFLPVLREQACQLLFTRLRRIPRLCIIQNLRVAHLLT